ncbi:hypothetical protein D3C72_2380950 [compost metagenome]
MPLNRAPDRASDLLLATGTSEAPASFPLDELVQAPVGRVDAFGVGITAETEAGRPTGAAQ